MARRQQNELDTSGKQTAVPGATSVFGEMDLTQYRQPLTPTRRAVLPSYARHIASEYSRVRQMPDGRNLMHTVTGIKMFRVEHRIIEAPQFLEFDDPEESLARQRDPSRPRTMSIKRGKLSPYHPAAYSPYYLGHYNTDGTLRDPYDPLLYWLTPVQYLSNNTSKDQRNFEDWMSKYAGHEFPWEGKE
jgi:hypothetical protein